MKSNSVCLYHSIRVKLFFLDIPIKTNKPVTKRIAHGCVKFMKQYQQNMTIVKWSCCSGMKT